MAAGFHRLRVASIRKPTPDATTIGFDIPSSSKSAFGFAPGQHLIIDFLVDGRRARRSYSINSCAFSEDQLEVTVKRVQGGVVSNFVQDHLSVGDELDVMAPQGRFAAHPEASGYKTYFLFAAGSGITPIFSILKSVLHGEPKSFVRLFYGNKNQDSIIFASELKRLCEAFPDRLAVEHTLSAPKSFSGWKGRKGIIDRKAVEWFVDRFPPPAQDTEYYACGPGGMNLTVRDTLIELGVPKSRVHIEHFGPLPDAAATEIVGVEARLTAHLRGEAVQVTVPAGQTVLQVLRERGADPPYSCEAGVCSTCVATVVKGSAQMRHCMALDDDDVKKGLVLTCQAVPTSGELEVRYHD